MAWEALSPTTLSSTINTESSISIPPCMKATIQARTSAEFRMTHFSGGAGASTGNYLTVKANGHYNFESVGGSSFSVIVASTVASLVIETCIER